MSGHVHLHMPSVGTSACLDPSWLVQAASWASPVAALVAPGSLGSWESCGLWHSWNVALVMASVLGCPGTVAIETNPAEAAIGPHIAVVDLVPVWFASCHAHRTSRSHFARADDRSDNTVRSVCATVCRVCISTESWYRPTLL